MDDEDILVIEKEDDDLWGLWLKESHEESDDLWDLWIVELNDPQQPDLYNDF